MMYGLRAILILGALAFALPVEASFLQRLFKPAVRAGTELPHVLPTTRVTARPPIHILVPQDDDGYLQMFGRRRSGLVAEEMQQANKELAGTDSKFLSSLGDLRRALGQSESNAAYLVAHSDDMGKSLVLPNGERINIGVLEAACQAMGKVCIVVSCHSPHLGLSREIEYKHAISAVAESARAWQDRPAKRATLSRKRTGGVTISESPEDIEAPTTVDQLANYAVHQLNKLARGGARRISTFKAVSIGGSVVLVSTFVGSNRGVPQN